MTRRLLARYWCFLFLVFTFSSVSGQEVIYLKRSEVLPFVMGQQIGTLGGQILDARQYAAGRQAGYRQLEIRRQQLSQCANCPQRAQLETEVKELRALLFRQDGMLCGTFDALSDSNPAVDAMKGLMGFSEVCNLYNKEAQIFAADERNRRNKEEFSARIKRGDLSAYSFMGRRSFTTYSHLSTDMQLDIACPYFMEGLRKGDPGSTSEVGVCGGTSMMTDADKKQQVARLQSCKQAAHLCAYDLAVMYETTRRKDRTWAVETDDREALRFYEQVLSYYEQRAMKYPGDSSYAGAVRQAKHDVERVKARLESRSDGSQQAPRR